jgi:hypothetical protein
MMYFGRAEDSLSIATTILARSEAGVKRHVVFAPR